MLEIHALLMVLPRPRTQTRMSTWYWKYSTVIDTANSHGKTLQIYMVSLRALTFHLLRRDMRGGYWCPPGGWVLDKMIAWLRRA